MPNAWGFLQTQSLPPAQAFSEDYPASKLLLWMLHLKHKPLCLTKRCYFTFRWSMLPQFFILKTCRFFILYQKHLNSQNLVEKISQKILENPHEKVAKIIPNFKKLWNTIWFLLQAALRQTVDLTCDLAAESRLSPHRGATFSSLSSTPINGGHDAKIWLDFERLPSLDSLENCPAHSQHPNTRNDHLKKRFWSVFYLGWFTNKVYRNLPANCCLTDVCQSPTEGELSWPATQRTPQCGWQLSYDRKHDAVGVLTRTLEPLMLRWDICEYYGLWK